MDHGAQTTTGTDRYDGSALILEDDTGWRRTAREPRLGHGLLLRFTLGQGADLLDCFAISLAGPCGTTGRYTCEGLQVPGDTLFYSLELSADYGVLASERSHTGTAYDRGIYLFEDPDDGAAVTLVFPRGRFGPLAAPGTGRLDAETLTLDLAGDRAGHPLRCTRERSGRAPGP